MALLPHSTIDKGDAGAQQSGENMRALDRELKTKVTGYLVTVDRYTAVGSTSAKVRVIADDRPAAVLLVNAAPVYSATGTLAVSPNMNFAWDATTRSIDAYEPSGLTANTVYSLTYLILEA